MSVKAEALFHPEAVRSPEYVQLSTAAAITLGLLPGRMYRTDCTHCLNLLVTYPEGCRANCSYCGLARHRDGETPYADRNFIRVGWPAVRYEELIARIARGEDGGRFQRMCISMITHPDSDADTFTLLHQWVAALPHIPVSILSNPTTLGRDDLVALREAGAEIFTVALDAATPELFERTRGRAVQSPHTWARYWRALDWAAEVFGPGRFGAHLICGLGESEAELLECCQAIRDRGGRTHLFAFQPEAGSQLEDRPPVPADQWRRVQLGCYLIDHAETRVEAMRFDGAGRLVDYGVAPERLERVVAAGTAFRTSGCPGPEGPDVSACNRPYGDCTPGDIRSFPFAPVEVDLKVVRRQLAGERIATGSGLGEG
ncbi:MAG TPA: radical SAM protein [Gammaproteobacteria bacterium]|nr:radical SAM protein [Gammaproteobacteria bacterium]